MGEKSNLHLYTSQFCPYSQRPIIALHEAGVNFELTEIPSSDKLPEWFVSFFFQIKISILKAGKRVFELSPHGAFPILKEAEGNVVVGSDAICAYLEKFPKISKLFLNKKKKYNSALIHCKTKFEPLIDLILDDSVIQRSFDSLKELLLVELEFIDSNIKGPFFMGSNISWIDINYWTTMERFPLLKHVYDIEIPKNFKNIHLWLDRMNKRPTFEKAKFQLVELIPWYDTMCGKINIGPVAFMKTVNTALRGGITELLKKVEESDIFNNRDHAKDICNTFSSFDTALRDTSRAKLQIYFRAIEEKEPKFTLELSKKFEEEQQLLDDIHDLLTKSIHISNLRHQIASQTINKKTPEKNQSLKSVLTWKLEKYEKENPPNNIKKDLLAKTKEFRDLITANLEIEENTLTEKKILNLVTNRQAIQIAKRIICLSNESSFKTYHTWIIVHLPIEEVDQYMRSLYAALPYQFTDICQVLEETVPNEIWEQVLAKLENPFETPLRSSPAYQQLLKPPVEEKKEEAEEDLPPIVIEAENNNNNNNNQNNNNQSNANEDSTSKFDNFGPKRPKRRPTSKNNEEAFAISETPQENSGQNQSQIQNQHQNQNQNQNQPPEQKVASGLSQVINQLFKNSPDFHANRNFFEEKVKGTPNVPPPRPNFRINKINSNPNRSNPSNNNPVGSGSVSSRLETFERRKEQENNQNKYDKENDNKEKDNKDNNNEKNVDNKDNNNNDKHEKEEKSSIVIKEENPSEQNKENKENNELKEESLNENPRPTNGDVWEKFLHDNTKQTLSIFTLASKVIKNRIIHLEDMVKRRHRLANLAPLEEALEVLTYIVIQDLQSDVAVFPALCREKEDLSAIFKVYSLDHSVTLKLIKRITNHFIKIKGSNEQLETSLDILYEDITQVITLEKYFISKEESLIFPLIAEIIPVHSQPRLTREILDISPPQYFSKMLPWIVRNLSVDDQIIFVETLRAVLPKHQFDSISIKIRKVLPVQISDNLFGRNSK